MEDVENASMEQMKKMMNYPLIKNCDMTEEMRQDCSDLVITAVEKHANNFEAAARLVKEAMDKKYNESWVVVIGEGFSFEVTHQVKHVLWMYTSNSVAVLVYKGAPAAVSAVARCRPLPPPQQPRPPQPRPPPLRPPHPTPRPPPLRPPHPTPRPTLRPPPPPACPPRTSLTARSPCRVAQLVRGRPAHSYVYVNPILRS